MPAVTTMTTAVTKTKTKSGSGDPDPYKSVASTINKKNKNRKNYIDELIIKPSKIQSSLSRTTLFFSLKNKYMTVKITWNKTKCEYEVHVYVSFEHNMYFATDDIPSILNHILEMNK